MWPYVIGGLVLAGVYSIATLGLILTYTSSRVFNFAHGAIAFFLAIFFHWLAVDHGWNPKLAGAFVVLVCAPLFGLFLWWALFRRLTEATSTIRLVSTIGLWVALPAIGRILFVGREEIFDRTGVGPTPAASWIRVAGTVIDSDEFLVLLVSVVVAVSMTIVLRYTPYGLQVRATVDSPRMAGISGINTNVVSAGSWMIGTTLAGAAGVLLAPLKGYQELNFTPLVLAMFAAAVIARFHSLVMGVVGCLLIGMTQSFIPSKWVRDDFLYRVLPDQSQDVLISKLPDSVPFILLLIFLLCYRGVDRERFAVDTRAAATDGPPPTARDLDGWRRFRTPAILILIVLLAPVPLAGRWEAIIAKGLAVGIAFLSYTIVAGEGGMVSLCQVAFAGIGGAMTAQLATNDSWTWLPQVNGLLAIFLAALIVVPFGLLVALPSLRLGELYLAMATLAFAVLTQNLFFQSASINNFDGGVKVPRPHVFGVDFKGDTPFYYLLVVLFVLAAILVMNVKRSTTGLNLAATRSSEIATATLGISVVRNRLIAFGVSSFLAAFAGGLSVTYVGIALPAREFDALIGVVWLAIAVTWGVRSVAGALLAGLSFALFPQIFAEFEWFILVLFGLIMLGIRSNVRRVVVQRIALALWALFWLGAFLVWNGNLSEVPLIADSIREIPTTLFGLGAIGLAKEPRGIVYDVAHRSRAGRAERAARRSAGPSSADEPEMVMP